MSLDDLRSFSELELQPALLKALAELSHETPTPIQAQAIPPLLQGVDILGQAQTGTGKTAAFALPLIQRVDTGTGRLQALVLTPTRELAMQVAEAIRDYARHFKDLQVMSIYGGQDMGRQLAQLRRRPQVVVGTPGRVMDHMRRGSLVLGDLQTLVLDEADEMLNMGFIDDIEWILDSAPTTTQLALFSATMPSAISRVAKKHLKTPKVIRIESKTSTVEATEQLYLKTTQATKREVLSRVLEVEPIDGVLIFVRTRTDTADLSDVLERRGYRSTPLSGDMSQEARERAVEALKKNRVDIIVATDVAARGIDVKRISHVFNYDLPHDAEAYVHRIGRTGRAGRKGKAISLVNRRDVRWLTMVERSTRSKLQVMQIPDAAALGESRLSKLAQALQQTMANESLDSMASFVDRLSQELDTEVESIAAALLFHHQQNRPLQPHDMSTLPGKRERKASPRTSPYREHRNSRSDNTRFKSQRDGAQKPRRFKKRGDNEETSPSEATTTSKSDKRFKPKDDTTRKVRKPKKRYEGVEAKQGDSKKSLKKTKSRPKPGTAKSEVKGSKKDSPKDQRKSGPKSASAKKNRAPEK
jgi:ATP-dependent RNA helicase DeaD